MVLCIIGIMSLDERGLISGDEETQKEVAKAGGEEAHKERGMHAAD
jgi:hypothetical protein